MTLHPRKKILGKMESQLDKEETEGTEEETQERRVVGEYKFTGSFESAAAVTQYWNALTSGPPARLGTHFSGRVIPRDA